jgi:glycosyltransferase involved in cell wall biosynthesis
MPKNLEKAESLACSGEQWTCWREGNMTDASRPYDGDMRKVLMVAHSFPPFFSVGGSIRVVKFTKYLPALGWLPIVLTIDDRREYETTRKMGSETLLADIPRQVLVHRTAAGELSLEHLEKEKAFGQRHRLAAVMVKVVGGARRWVQRSLFLPDRHLAWLPFALSRGRQIVKSDAIDVIFSTCPPHSACLTGACLKLVTGKPLVLDFRDDWIDTPWYDSRSRVRRKIERKLEKWAVKTADKVILVTEWSTRAFLDRYPTEPQEKFIFIPNGCDLEEFAAVRWMPEAPPNSKFTILHAGLLNDSQSWARSPAALFQALRHILQQPEIAENLTLAFTGYLPEGHRRLAEGMGLSGVVKDLGHLPRDEFLRLMKSADLLLAINYEGFSTLIPGKIYEYWAVGGPPILLLSCDGAARELVEQKGLGIAVPHDDVAAIEEAILTAYRRRAMGSPMQVNTMGIEEYDRKALSERLAHVLSSVASTRCEKTGISFIRSLRCES